MNILIIGCGRVGSTLAEMLCKKGHDISILDKKITSFELLDDCFTGLTFVGVPIDDEALRKAGIMNCDAVCAVTDDDDVNIMASQLARDIFGVPKVIARILTPDKEDIYQSFGLDTICPTNLTVDAIISTLEDDHEDSYMRYGNHTLKFSTVSLPKNYIGERADKIGLEEGEALYAISHNDGSFVLVLDYSIILSEGDKLIFTRIVD